MSAGRSQELKGCQTLLAKQKGDLEAVEREFTIAAQKRAAIKATIKELEERISKLTECAQIIVSEHAMLRYFERVGGFSLDEVNKIILSDNAIAMIREFGSGTFPTGNGFSVVVKNNTVVSVITQD